MHTAKRYLLIAVTFATALGVFAAFTPKIAHAITATLVQVVNTSSNPVPTQPVGNTSVQGTVGIDPANNSVQVTNVPAVQLASGGSSDQPLFVRDSDNPARQPFSVVRTCQISVGSYTCMTPAFTVPFGKRAVIETVGLVATVDDLGGEGDDATLEVTVSNGTDNAIFGFAAKDQSGNNLVRIVTPVGTFQTRLYAEPGSQVSMSVGEILQNQTFSLTERVSLMGYYVDVQ